MDLSFLTSWLEKLVSARARQRATDLKMADRARMLQRELEASFNDWPHAPTTAKELESWAFRLARGYATTEPAMRELVDLRPEASRNIRRAAGAARDSFFAAADVINREVEERRYPLDIIPGERVDDVGLRRAFAEMQRCLTELSAIASRGK